MYKRVFSFFILSVVNIYVGWAQTVNPFYQIGYFTDQDNQPLDEFVDFTYNSKKEERYTFVMDEKATPGYYYDLNGNRINGRIKYSQSEEFFNFTPPSGNDKAIKIKPSGCLGYVIGKDSFAVIRNFTVERKLFSDYTEALEFAEVITKVGDITFYQHTRMDPNHEVITYMARRKEGAIVSFPKSKIRFKEVALDFFGDSEYLKSKINNETFTEEDLLHMIKYLDYNEKMNNKERIYYASSWEELEDSSEYGYLYYADLISMDEGICTISYFIKDGTPMYTGSYTQLSPQKKDGVFIFKFPNGTLRKIMRFKNNEVTDSVMTYYPNGKEHYVYKIEDEHHYDYLQVKDLSGKNLLDENGTGTEFFYDSIRHHAVTRVYKSNKLSVAYYTAEDGTKVYQACKNAAVLYSKEALENNEFIKEIHYPTIAISNNIHGLVLINILTDSDGNTVKISIAKGLDYECDKVVLNHCLSKYKGKNWYPLKIDKVKVPQEIVLAFVFELGTYSRYRNHYPYNNFWMQQNMMQQRMMIAPSGPKMGH